MLGKINDRSDPVIGKARSDTDTDTETETERIRWFWHFEILSILSHLAACRIPTQSRINSAVVGKNQASGTPEGLEDQGIESRP